jgi:hypothetical protein
MKRNFLHEFLEDDGIGIPDFLSYPDTLEVVWKSIPPEELAEMKEGEPVVAFTTEWRNGKRLNHFRRGTFRRYASSLGIVLVGFPLADGWLDEVSYCARNVGRLGRCEIPEHCELHGDFEGYDE